MRGNKQKINYRLFRKCEFSSPFSFFLYVSLSFALAYIYHRKSILLHFSRVALHTKMVCGVWYSNRSEPEPEPEPEPEEGPRIVPCCATAILGQLSTTNRNDKPIIIFAILFTPSFYDWAFTMDIPSLPIISAPHLRHAILRLFFDAPT